MSAPLVADIDNITSAPLFADMKDLTRALVFFELINELRKSDKMRGLPIILSLFRFFGTSLIKDLGQS